MTQRKIPELKPLFVDRMKQLLSDEGDFDSYTDILKKEPVRSIRCNTLKISTEELKKRLEDKGWKINQPWKNHKDVMIVENELEPGELGRSIEHVLGYYYIQELASMLPIIALFPKPGEMVLDLCAAPGSKTTQTSSFMEDKGNIIANEVNLGRIKILASNLERCGCSNVIITRKDGIVLCNRLRNKSFLFDKILVDAPCSGEGTLRSSPRTYLMWNIKTINILSRIQKQLLESAINVLKVGGEIIYSTCTHAPEENEEVIDYILEKYKGKIEIEKIKLPIKTREGITEWNNKKYSKEVKKCARVYPQDNDTEGFFIAKLRRIS